MVKSEKVFSKKLLVVLAVSFVLLLPVSVPVAADTSTGTDYDNAYNRETAGETGTEENIEVPDRYLEEPLELTLEEAKEMVLENSLEMELAELKVDKAEFADDRQRSWSRDMENIRTYDQAVAKEVAKRATEMELTVARREQELKENSLLFEAENSYYGLLKAQKDLENSRFDLARSKEQLRISEELYDAGMIARGELVGARSSAAASEASLSATKSQWEKAMMELADVLNLPLEKEIKAVSALDYEPADIDMEKVIEETLETDIGVLAASEAEELAELRFDIAQRYYTPNTYIYKEDRFDLQERRLDLDQAEKSVISSVRSAWFDLQAAEAGYRALEESLAYAQENYRIEQIRYQEGVSTLLEVEDAQSRLNEREKERIEMLYNYNLAKAQFEYLLFGQERNF